MLINYCVWATFVNLKYRCRQMYAGKILKQNKNNIRNKKAGKDTAKQKIGQLQACFYL